MNLDNILNPVARKKFESEYFEQKPLVISRGDMGYYDDLLSLPDVDRILSSASLRSSIRLSKDGHAKPFLGDLATRHANQVAGGLEALYQEYRDGSTIILAFLNEYWIPLKHFCRTLAQELSAGVQANAYLTPPNAQGFDTHYDTHDVLVLQVHGSKAWRIFDADTVLPLPDNPYSGRERGELGVPLEEIELTAGGLLYIPRGFPHDARSFEASSLHVTIGLKSPTWASVINGAISRKISADSRYRASMPIGFATDADKETEARGLLLDIFSSIFAAIDLDDVLAQEKRRADLQVEPGLFGHLLDLEALQSINSKTSVHVREEMLWKSERNGETGALVLEFHGKRVQLPPVYGPALQFIGDAGGSFTASQLPSSLGEDRKILLVKRLLREGFLTSG